MPLTPTNPPSRSAGGQVELRHPKATDGKAMWALAEGSGLDRNSPYAYVMWGEHFSATSIVAESEGVLVGFLSGFRLPDEPSTVFVWQVAVDGTQRGKGIGGQMLDELVARTGARAVEATVTPDNAASDALFRALGARQGTAVTTEVAFGEHLFPGGHDAEIRYRIPIANETPKD